MRDSQFRVPPFDPEKFLTEIDEQGYYLLEAALEPDFVSQLKMELEKAIEKEAEYHGKTDYQDYGMVLLCSLYGGAFLRLLEKPQILEPFEAYLGEGCILYSYTSSSLPPHGGNYSTRIHVDSPRIIKGYNTLLGCFILLDDFTEENGATYFLPNSHQMINPPEESYFFQNAKRLTAKAGSIWFINPRLYHSGGINKTDQWRHGVAVGMCRPFMKQRLDVPRAMAHMDLSSISDRLKQKLGFYAQVPASYDEYYQPPEKRKFRQKVE